ncbi:MAG: epoxyqueuosine reductase QueH [Clostridia bacterium]|nr:epoxyqueuosine reductase QueH [Clostridia bacterium]
MQKVNYNLVMKQQLSALQGKPRLLLHVCCAPCSSGVLPKLKEYSDITLYYYNPNTYPKDEYLLRAEQFAKLTDLPLVVCDYNHNEFLDAVKGFEQNQEGGTRCQKCIELRLENSFNYAKTNNYDYVTTTLSISPHKDAQFINSCGKKLQQQYNVTYLYADFKKDNGFLFSINESKKYDLYRQEYCGCEFSFTTKN